MTLKLFSRQLHSWSSSQSIFAICQTTCHRTWLLGLGLLRSRPFSRSCSAFWERRVVQYKTYIPKARGAIILAHACPCFSSSWRRAFAAVADSGNRQGNNCATISGGCEGSCLCTSNSIENIRTHSSVKDFICTQSRCDL
jgi:hypothetical protein